MLYYWQNHRTDFLILMGTMYILLLAIIEVPKRIRNRRRDKENEL